MTGVGLVISIAANALLAWALIQHRSDVRSYGDAQRIVAHEIFFDSLRKNEIDILALPPATDGVVSCGGYTIRIRRLEADEAYVGVGCRAFTQLYYGLVLGFACSKWEDDRVLSLSLIKILTRVYQPAVDLMDLISERGIEDSSVVDLLRSYARRFEWYQKEQEQQPDHQVDTASRRERRRSWKSGIADVT